MYRFRLAFIVPGIAVVLFASLAGAQPQRNTMEVTIIATDKSSGSVQDLKQSDITIKDNNKKQEIVSFEKIAPGPATPGKPAVHNIVLLDCLNTTYGDMPEIRAEILKVLNELSKAENTTMLVLRQDLKPVSDPASPDGLLKRFARQGFDPAKPDASNWVFTDDTALPGLFAPVAVTDRVKIESWIRWLQVIARNFQGRSGRKNLYWISQNFPLVMGETGAGYLESAASGSTGTGTELFAAYARDMDLTAKMVKNANIAVYPIDARYLSRNTADVSDKSKMDDLAKATGGVAYASRKDVAAAVREAIGDSGTVYVVRYAISDLQPDGKAHTIKIETSRKDVKLRARDGYFAPQQGR
jgi:VWFA-related protein